MGKYCVIHISETRGAIDTKFAGYIHPVLPEVFSAFGVARWRGVPAAEGWTFLGWGYSFSWIGQLLFVFAWASSNVVQYLGDRLAHVLMQIFLNRPRGFYTVAQKIRKFILLTISGVYFLVSQKRQRISAHKEYQNKGGYLPCAAVPLSFLCCLQGGSKHHWYNFVIWTFLTIFGVYFLISQKRQRISAHNEYQK